MRQHRWRSQGAVLVPQLEKIGAATAEEIQINVLEERMRETACAGSPPASHADAILRLVQGLMASWSGGKAFRAR